MGTLVTISLLFLKISRDLERLVVNYYDPIYQYQQQKNGKFRI